MSLSSTDWETETITLSSIGSFKSHPSSVANASSGSVGSLDNFSPHVKSPTAEPLLEDEREYDISATSIPSHGKGSTLNTVYDDEDDAKLCSCTWAWFKMFAATIWCKILGIFVLVVAIAGVISSISVIRDGVFELGKSMNDMNPFLAILVYVVTYLPLTMLFIPRPLFSIIAGFLFGFWGILLESPCSVAGALVALLIGRTFLRKKVEAMVAEDTKLQALDAALQEKAATIIILLRVSPFLPYPVNNAVISMSSVNVFKYTWASWVGLLPYSLIYVAIGSSASELSDAFSQDEELLWWEILVFVAGIVFAAVLVLILGHIARTALEKEVSKLSPRVSPSSSPAAAKRHRLAP